MTQSYSITVLIPCHSLDYLSKSIESITRQSISKQQFEVLLVADRINLEEAAMILGSTSLNFRIIESTEPGIVPALNLGLANIRSEFVARMDEDDLMLPERLHLQRQYLNNNKKTLVVGGQLRLIDVSDKVIGQARYRNEIETASSKVLQSSPIAHPAAMFRREAVEQIGGYRAFLPEDWDLWVRLNERGPIANVAEFVLDYRIHPNQLSREKMYAQHIGGQFVSVSHFARKMGLDDAPIFNESNSDWLDKTQKELRTASKAFRHFERMSQKIRLINDGLQMESHPQRLQKIFFAFWKYPIVTSRFLIPKIVDKKKSINK
jgi:glycosyltransferase involved in cell wall biosynthesis